MNIRDIARLADVTPGTVSKVLNNYPDVGEATRQHVLKIIAENQYEPKGRGKKAEALPPRIGMVVWKACTTRFTARWRIPFPSICTTRAIR